MLRAVVLIVVVGIVIRALFDAMYWQQYFDATPEQRKEFLVETQLERNCKQDYVLTPPQLATPSANPMQESQRQQKLAEWQHGVNAVQAMSCRDYEAYKQKSAAEKKMEIFFEHCLGLFLLTIALIYAFIALGTSNRHNQRRHY